MIESHDFLKSVLDSITEHIVVIDSEGNILFVNRTWNSFAQSNAGRIHETWNGVNYLKECDKAADMGDDFGAKAATGIRLVIKGDEENFYLEYPCHSPDEKRWFMMRVTRFTMDGRNCFVISHQNITERKLAEEDILNLSRIDGLTGLHNRRYFNEFLDSEWKRCRRLGMPISLAIVDLDDFKLLNDGYGHQVGDECLKSVARVLKEFSKRPGDLSARYGGEEFALVFGNTSLDQAKTLAGKLLNEIRALNIPNEKSSTLSTLTASIGLATLHPNEENSESNLINKADKLLYSAKKNGRNQICFS